MVGSFASKILDGRSRHVCCLAAGVPPRYSSNRGGDPLQYVVSRNLHRRHLTTAQRAMAAADAKKLEEAEARKRQAATQFKAGMQPVVENLPPPHPSENGKARDKVTELFRVSGKTVDMAERVVKRGVPPARAPPSHNPSSEPVSSNPSRFTARTLLTLRTLALRASGPAGPR